MVLDLRTQGPHALVGGTTGAGKSEFLQAWVLGMAAAHSPDRVTFLFVDYKGGSAFADCVELPHCVGLVTDLSPHLVRRALTSLRAELQNREHLLNRKKANMLNREFAPGFRIDLHHKDMGIVTDAARAVGAALPVGAVVAQLVASARANGDGSLDHSALLRGVERLSGRTV